MAVYTIVCNRLLNKYGEALAHRKYDSTMGKSDLIRLDHIPNLVEEACVVKCGHFGSKVASSSWPYDLSKQTRG